MASIQQAKGSLYEPKMELRRPTIGIAMEDYNDEGRDCALILFSHELYDEFSQKGDRQALRKAIQIAMIVANQTPQEHRLRTDSLKLLFDIADTLRELFTELNEIYFVNTSIEVREAYITLVSRESPDMPGHLGDLAGEYHKRAIWYQNLEDIETAIRLERDAIELIDVSDKKTLSQLYNGLSAFLGFKHCMTGQIKDLDDAIGVAQSAVSNLSGEEDNEDLLYLLHTLGDNLELRYAALNELRDLKAAIEHGTHAMALISYSDQIWPSLANALGDKLEEVFHRSGDIQHMNKAIEYAEAALRLAHVGHPYRGHALGCLGNRLGLRWEKIAGQDIEDLKRSIDLTREAIRLIPEGHSDRAIWLNNLGANLRQLYIIEKSLPVLDEAIQCLQSCVGLYQNNQYHASLLKNTGFCLRHRYKHTGSRTDLEKSAKLLLEAWESPMGTVIDRVEAVEVLLKILHLLGEPEIDLAARLATEVVELFPAVDTNSLTVSDLQFVMLTFSTVASLCCSALLQAKQVERALECLERSRVVTLGYLMDTRSGMSRLKVDHPHLAEKLAAIRTQSEETIARNEGGSFSTESLGWRGVRSLALQACLEEVRSLPGYETFFLNQTVTQMQQSAQNGVIVIINVTEFRSDAILVSSTTISSFPLEDLVCEEIKPWKEIIRLAGGVSPRGKRGLQKVLLEFLAWLWQVCVRQVLDHTAVRERSLNGNPARIWWIGTGVASSVPFHAAGLHTENQEESAISRTISSYTPSIRALQYARDRQKSSSLLERKVVIATMDKTDDAQDLPSALIEQNAISEILKKALPVDILYRPTVDKVIRGISECTIFHVACHAQSNPIHAERSLLSFRGSEEVRNTGAQCLFVKDILELELPNAELAYLSACHTVDNSVEELCDEVVHLASAFLVTGFRHTIGSLWAARDDSSAEIAADFYRAALENRWIETGEGNIAEALRDSVMSHRSDCLNAPLSWANFVHFGP